MVPLSFECFFFNINIFMHTLETNVIKYQITYPAPVSRLLRKSYDNRPQISNVP